MVFKPITAQAALGTSSGGAGDAASTIGSSTVVRLVNTAAAEHLVTVETTGAVVVGTFTLETLKDVIIFKKADDQIFAANAAVLACGVEVAGPSRLH